MHLQDAEPAEALGTSAAHHSLACVLATLAVLPQPDVPFSQAASALLPLVGIFPDSSYLSAALHSVYRRAHQLCHLRINVAKLGQHSAAQNAIPFVLASAGAVSELSSGHQHVRVVFETALAGAPVLAAALQSARLQSGASTDLLAADSASLAAGTTAHRNAIEGVDFAALVQAPAAPGQPLASAPVVWLAYMQALVRRGAVSDAHAVFLRALAACPWCKSLWLRGLHVLADAVQGQEAAQLLDAMQQRGIELRTLPAEVLLERLQGLPVA